MEFAKYLLFALNELGVSEAVGDADNPRILQYFSATNYPTEQVHDSNTPWCAAFVCFCLEQCGYQSPHSAWSLNFLKYGETIATPQVGSIAVLSRTSDPAKGHVGFVLGFDDKNLYLLSGNTSNQVTIDRFDKSRALGFRLPKLAN